MKILMVSDAKCVHAQRPFNWLREFGYDVLFADFGGARSFSISRDSVVPYPPRRGQKKFSRLFGDRLGVKLADCWQLHRVKALISQHRPTITHVHWVGEAAWHLSSLGINNLVLTAWGSDINRFFDGTGPNDLRRKVSYALRNSRMLLADSDDIFLKAEALARRKLTCRLLTLGVDIEKFVHTKPTLRRKWRERLNVVEDTFLFGSVRAWHPLHNHDLILEAFAKATHSVSKSIALVFKVYHPTGVSEHEQYETRLQLRADELGIADRVFWLKGVSNSELPEAYSAFDAIVNFPARDALPVTFFEAAAARKPVVTCRLPAYEIPFVTNHFHLARTGDINSLAESMVAAVQESDSQRLGRVASAFEAVRRDYSEDASKHRLDALYKEIAGNHTMV